MATVAPHPPEPAIADLTLGDLINRFGPIPLRRIVMNPLPGTATEAHLLRLHRRTGRIYELTDGILVEKDVSFKASLTAALIIHLLKSYLHGHGMSGVVAGADGLVRLPVGRIRGPDVAFFSLARLPGGTVPPEAIPCLVPDLAVEVLSPGNTRREMADKLAEYFDSGVRLVWYVDPQSHTVRVFTAQDVVTTLAEADTLDGGNVLPGFSVKVAELFAEP